MKGEKGGESEGPSIPTAADGGCRVGTVEPYLVVDILDSPTLSEEGPSPAKTDTPTESPCDLHSHPTIDPTYSPVDPTHSSIDPTYSPVDPIHPSIDPTHSPTDPTQPPVKRHVRPAPPPPKPADRRGETSTNQVQSAPTDPAGTPSPSSSTASKPSPSGSLPPDYPAPHPPAQADGDCDPVDSSREGDAKGSSTTAIHESTESTESTVVEKPSTTPRPRRKPPPPPAQPSGMPTDPLHRKKITGSTSSLTRSNSLPREQKHSNSSELKFATLQAGSHSRSLRLRGQHVVVVEPPVEKKKGKLQLRGLFKKLSGSPNSKRSLQHSSAGSGGA